MPRAARAALISLALSCLVGACEEEPRPEVPVGTACDSQFDCGGAQFCHLGICTVSCTEDLSCGELPCANAGAPGFTHRICLPTCEPGDEADWDVDEAVPPTLAPPQSFACVDGQATICTALDESYCERCGCAEGLVCDPGVGCVAAGCGPDAGAADAACGDPDADAGI